MMSLVRSASLHISLDLSCPNSSYYIYSTKEIINGYAASSRNSVYRQGVQNSCGHNLLESDKKGGISFLVDNNKVFRSYLNSQSGLITEQELTLNLQGFQQLVDVQITDSFVFVQY